MEETTKRKRGRPRKNPIVELVQEMVLELVSSEEISIKIDEKEAEDEMSLKEMVETEKARRKGEWDITINDPINFFDPVLSYEITGYKPIDKEHGLEFNPDWFTETREVYLRTGHYCLYPRRTKAFNDFWDIQYDRCRNGMTSHGYTITGDHYFFLNFYQLDDLTSSTKAGGGRSRVFPNFFTELYKYFHYLEICKKLRKHCVMMKARGVNKPALL